MTDETKPASEDQGQKRPSTSRLRKAGVVAALFIGLTGGVYGIASAATDDPSPDTSEVTRNDDGDSPDRHHRFGPGPGRLDPEQRQHMRGELREHLAEMREHCDEHAPDDEDAETSGADSA